MAVATRPVPRMTEPVFVTRLGEEGRLLMISAARSSGGGLLDELAMPRLHFRDAHTHGFSQNCAGWVVGMALNRLTR